METPRTSLLCFIVMKMQKEYYGKNLYLEDTFLYSRYAKYCTFSLFAVSVSPRRLARYTLRGKSSRN